MGGRAVFPAMRRVWAAAWELDCELVVQWRPREDGQQRMQISCQSSQIHQIGH